KPEFYGIHQTFLGQLADGRWVKRDHPDLPDEIRVPKGLAKIVSGTQKGGFIRLWTGIGPRGGKAAPLSQGKGHVWIAEGIEDALSAVVLDPTRRVLAGINLGNLREMVLPAAIERVILIGDNDESPDLLAELETARARFAEKHGVCIIWRNPWGGKDLNDALVKYSIEEV
ncbi:MAG: toprim domain-containing protein, partial [Rhodobacterales bacterium]